MYKTDNFNRAKEIIDNRRSEARNLSNKRMVELELKSPEIREIDEELRRIGPMILKTACEGGDITPIKERNLELNAKRRELTVALGYPEDYADVKYTCPKCQDSGYVDIKMCSCLKELLLIEGIKASGMGRLIEEQSFDNFDMSVYADEASREHMEKLIERARRFAEGFDTKYRGKSLLFIGKTGTGKTHISTSIARAVIGKGYSVIYDSVQNIINDFEDDKFRSGYARQEPISDKYLDCDLLIIDDLGTEFTTPFSVSCLYNIFTTRRNRGLSTIVSTNLSGEEITKKYDDRIYSRIVGSDYTVLSFVGNDYRLRKRR